MDFLFDARFRPLPAEILIGRDTYIASYDPNLVLLSLVIATLAGLVALTIAARMVRIEARLPRLLWLCAGSVVMAGGIWAMHFVGMLAFSLPCAIDYDLPITLLSTLPALVASFVALAVSSRPGRLAGWKLPAGGLAMGLGIGAMHYAGMAAMRMDAILLYDPVMVLVSVAVAGALAWASLTLNVRTMARGRSGWSRRGRRLAAALFMGLAVAGMHYTAMGAAIFLPAPGSAPDLHAVPVGLLAFLISVVTAAVIAATLSIVVASMQRENAQILKESMKRREEAERAADERGRRLQAILDNLAEGIVTISGDGVILHWSPSAERLFGYSAAEVEGRNVTCLMPEPYASQHDGYLEAYRRTGVARVIGSGGRKVAGKRKDGTVFPLYLAIGKAELSTGTVFTGILRDLSVEEAAKADLERKEQQLRDALNSMPDGLCMVDEEGRVLMANARFAELIDLPPASIGPGVLLARLLPPEAVAGAGKCELRIGRRAVEVEWSPAESGGHVVLAHDVTQRLQTEEDLRTAKERAEAAAQAKSAFLANMSHEIRTPMNSVLGFLTLALEDPALPPELRRYLGIADRSARSLLQIINDILDLSKLESGAVSLERMPLSVRDCVRGILDAMSLKAREKGLDLIVDIDARVPDWVEGDPTRLRQVLLNLVGNAVKFTERGRVVVRVRPEAEGESRLSFEVEDTGIGIAPDRLEAIFEPFSQEDAGITRRFGGSGLGTTICRQLVELMGGRISVVSAPGQGSTFSFVLPLPACAPPSSLPESDEPGPVRRTYSVLVVEDIAENRLLLELRLRRRGHKVILAADGAEGLALFRLHRPDLVLMDVHMPGMDGLAATAAIRAAEAAEIAAGRRSGPTPIIALTASVMEGDRQRCLEAGMDAVAAKPVEFRTLLPLMDRLAGYASEAAARAADPGPAGVPPGLLPLMEVADLELGLANWQDEAAYRKALDGFAARLDDWQRVAAALEQEDVTAAHAILHALKGLAGNLALTGVAAAAATLSSAVTGADRGADRAVLLQRLRGELEAVGTVLAKLPTPEAEAAGPAVEAGPAERRAALERLMAALETDNPDPVEREIAAMAGMLPPDRLGGVARAVAEFDFDAARAEVQALLAEQAAEAGPTPGAAAAT